MRVASVNGNDINITSTLCALISRRNGVEKKFIADGEDENVIGQGNNDK
jgi:hypothetical protein